MSAGTRAGVRGPNHFLARSGWTHNGRKYKLGNKKVYLPGHIVSLVPPHPNAPPTLHTFKVPLKFNKFDMRDYLFNLYNLKSLSVRSFISASAPYRATTSRHHPYGPWRRKQPIKMMTVELLRPFHYPPKPENLEPWDQSIHDKIQEVREENESAARRNMGGGPPVVGRRSEDDVDIGNEMRRVLKGGSWSNGIKLDERWKRLAKNALKKK